MEIKKYLREKRTAVEKSLRKYLPKASGDLSRLASAVRYSALSQGKRIRPILAVAAAEACGGRQRDVIPVACALECIHAFTLVHDDLPSIDDSDLRRGRPACHKAFDGSAAILAGDSLAILAFEIILRHTDRKRVSEAKVIKALLEVSSAAGFFGVIGGETLDIAFENTEPGIAALKMMYMLKTGALIRASVRCGAIIAGADRGEMADLTSYAEHLGLAFQITDDLLDLEGASKVTGKPVLQDKTLGKATILGAVGLDRARIMAEQEIEAAIEDIKGFGKQAEPLREIARFVIGRKM
jgi:geranylgeranyl diphosphate synthase type II